MATHYLLPCQCGKKNEIDAGQAGLTIRCQCGTELAVPTMRGLAALERLERAAPQTQTRPESTWGARQGLMFLGATIIAAAALAALWFWMQLPEPIALLPNYQTLSRSLTNQLTLEQTFEHWRELQTGIVQPAYEDRIAKYENYKDGIIQWEIACGGIAAVGLLLFFIGLLLPKRASRRTPAAANH